MGHHCPPSLPADDAFGPDGCACPVRFTEAEPALSVVELDGPLRGLETKLRAALPLVYPAVSKEVAGWAADAPEAEPVDGTVPPVVRPRKLGHAHSWLAPRHIVAHGPPADAQLSSVP